MPSAKPTADMVVSAGTELTGLDFSYVHDITVTNYGQIVNHATTYGLLMTVSSLGSSNITVDNYGLIEADGSTYPNFGGANANGFWLYLLPLISHVHNRPVGVIGANGTSAVAALGEKVTNEGSIDAKATGDLGVAIGVAANDLTNSGTITATAYCAYGVSLGPQTSYYGSNPDKKTLVNTGTITATSSTYSYAVGYGSVTPPLHEAYEITNYGTIKGAYSIWGTGSCRNAAITNYGNLIGDVSLGGSGDTLTNEGTIDGDVYLGYGTETYVSTVGHINGDLYSGDGTCLFSFGANYDPHHAIVGGVGTDTVQLNGDYSATVTIGETRLMDVENLVVAAGHNYALRLDDVNVLAGHTLKVDGSALGTANSLNFDGSRGSEATYSLVGGAGNDTLIAAAVSTTKEVTSTITRLKLLPDYKLGSFLERDWVFFSPDGAKLYYITGVDVLGDGSNSTLAIYCKDLIKNTTTRISFTASGANLDGNMGLAALSPDGTKLAFVSGATNLVTGDTNGARDVFVKDLTTGSVTLVSTTAGGVEGNGNSGWLNTAIRFSPDGNALYFTSDATNLVTGDTNGVADLFAKNLTTGAITRVSTTADGSQLDGGTEPLFRQSISSDGTKILFLCNARNILQGYAFAGQPLFVKDLRTGAIQLVETTADGVYHSGFADSAALSPDGTKVLFISTSMSLVPGATSGKSLIYLKDLATGKISCVSTDEDGTLADGNCSTVSFSPDGTKILFTSKADNLVPHDTNGNPSAYNATSDAFIKDLVTGKVTRVDMNSDGTQASGNSTIPLFSPDGNSVFFASDGKLTPDCISNYPDYYLAKLSFATSGNDTLAGGAGDDLLTGGAGSDTLDGGAGNDTAKFSGNRWAYTVTANANGSYTVTGTDGTDTLTNIEMLQFADQSVTPADAAASPPPSGGQTISGTSGADTLTGGTDNDTINGGAGNDIINGGAGADTLNGGADEDTITGGAGNDALDGGSSVDKAVFSGNRAAYTITQTSTGNFTITGTDGTDTLTNIEYAKFDDQTMRLLPGGGTTVSFATDPSTYMGSIRDFDGNNLGGAASWKLIGSADVNGDGRAEHILFNREIGRWAEVGTEADGLTYFSNYNWAGDTRVVGIYIDPLVANGTVVKDSATDSQRRFQNDLTIDNIHGILGQGDYNHDGLQEVYFSLTDGTAYLHAYMHADGNIQYANYQNKQQVIDYLTSNGVSSSTWSTWFPAGQSVMAAVAG